MANTTTFIKLDRNIERWRWYGDKNTLAVWIHILLKANVKSSTFAGKTIKRGQFVFSQRKCAEDVGLTIWSFRTAIDHLVETGEITVDSFPRFTVITVVNYDKYQAKPTEEKPQKKPKQKEQKAKEGSVPEMYKEMFGDDYDAYKRWRDQ